MILTSDAATILRELDVVHPAAKLIVMASQQQEAEVRNQLPEIIALAVCFVLVLMREFYRWETLQIWLSYLLVSC
jgi:hypothetical protein